MNHTAVVAAQLLQAAAANLKERCIIAFQVNPLAAADAENKKAIAANAEWSRLFVFGKAPAGGGGVCGVGGRVGTVVRLSSTMSDASPAGWRKELVAAFTTDDLTLSDNFDAQRGSTVPVENVTFGAAKLCIEAFEIERFISDPQPANAGELMKHYEKSHGEANRLATERALGLFVEEGPFLESHMAARKQFLAHILAPKIGAMDLTVFKWAEKKKIPPSDPVVATCVQREVALSLESEEAIGLNDPDKIIGVYLHARRALLPLLPSTSPYIAKLAVGREVFLPIFDGIWSGRHYDLSFWSVFFARRYFMLAHPELAYLFCLFHHHGAQCETSDVDNLWAFQVQPFIKGQGGTLCVFKKESGGGNDEQPQQTRAFIEDFWRGLRSALPIAKLGRVNACVARSLLGERMTDEERRACRWAKNYLQQCGWAAFFDEHVVPLCGRVAVSHVFHDNDGHEEEDAMHLPPDHIRVIQQSTLEDVAEQLEWLARELQQQ